MLIPVLDLRGGIVVHAVAGRRDDYRPLKSQLTASTDPLTVLRDLQQATGLDTFYVADLDGICEGRADLETLRRLAATDCWLLIDAGAKTVEDLARVRLSPRVRPVVASETFEDLTTLLRAAPGDVVFSIDLHHGQLRLADRDDRWSGLSPVQLGQELAAAGLKDWIVLDTAAVGLGQGIPTLPLCRVLLEKFPEARLITGGGVRSLECVRRAEEEGVEGVLVATALHRGGEVGSGQ